MEKNAFRKITVQNITDKSKLNRQTFYYHFKDMYDLLEWIYRTEIFKCINEEGNKDWKNILLHTIKYAEKNKAFVRNTARSLKKETIEKFLYPFVYDWTLLFFNDTCKNILMKQDDKDFLLKFLTFAFVDMMIDWTEQGMKEDEYYWLEKMMVVKTVLMQFSSIYDIEKYKELSYENVPLGTELFLRRSK